MDEFEGVVPTTEKELMKLAGIGKKFADLLAFIFSNDNNE